MQEYDTLDITNVKVLSKPTLLTPKELGGLPVQVMALPWLSRSNFIAAGELSTAKIKKVDTKIDDELATLVNELFKLTDPTLPLILTSHGSVQGAVFGTERSVMLGNDLTLPGSLVRDPRLDYVALGHIHKSQNLNEGFHPPVIYPGSIERVDFGEAADDKFYVIARVERGHTEVEWRKLNGRRFIDRKANLAKISEDGMPNADELLTAMLDALPKRDQLRDAIVRLTIEYPRDWESLIDEPALRKHTEEAFDFHLMRRPQYDKRIRLPADEGLSTLPPIDLLGLYWGRDGKPDPDKAELDVLARQIIQMAENKGESEG